MPLIKCDADTRLNIEIYENIRQSYINEGYSEYSFIHSDSLTDFLSAVYGIPFAAIYIILYFLFNETIPEFDFITFIITVIFIYVTTPLHELLHGLGWSIFIKNRFKSIYIYIPLGISDAYCHCVEPLDSRAYIIGSIMPFVFLSIIPVVISVLIESPLLFYLGLFNAFGCGSDISNTISAYINQDKIILDYPTDCGFTAYKKEL